MPATTCFTSARAATGIPRTARSSRITICKFRYPRDLELVTPGDVVSDRTRGRLADHRTPYLRSHPCSRLQPGRLRARPRRARPAGRGCLRQSGAREGFAATAVIPPLIPPATRGRRIDPLDEAPLNPPPPDPAGRLEVLATEVSAAMEFMKSTFGPPALPHLTVSPIPGTFGQGFPGLIYLSTLAYLKHLPRATFNANQSQELYYRGSTASSRNGAPVVGKPRDGGYLPR